MRSRSYCAKAKANIGLLNTHSTSIWKQLKHDGGILTKIFLIVARFNIPDRVISLQPIGRVFQYMY